jgi:CotS family spore coat protein
MGMFYQRQYLRKGQEVPKIVQIVGLPSQILQKYDLEINEGEKIKKCWQLKGRDNIYWLWEYQGDLEVLSKVLEWREDLRKKGIQEFLPLYKTKEGKNYVRWGQSFYYLTAIAEGMPFVPQQSGGFLQVVEALAKLHNYSKDLVLKKTIQQAEKRESIENVWLKAYQERLTELLVFFHCLLEKRLLNDYERLYVESFESFYARGQEAIQKMALACCSSENDCVTGFLVGNFLSDNLLETKKGVVFLETTYSQKGFSIQDLSLFLKMYLPVKKWDVELAKKILTHYQEKVVLSNKEKQMLLAQLSFPGRYCFYAEQYFNGGDDVDILIGKLKNYLYEVYWQDCCLEELRKWLLGE